MTENNITTDPVSLPHPSQFLLTSERQKGAKTPFTSTGVSIYQHLVRPLRKKSNHIPTCMSASPVFAILVRLRWTYRIKHFTVRPDIQTLVVLSYFFVMPSSLPSSDKVSDMDVSNNVSWEIYSKFTLSADCQHCCVFTPFLSGHVILCCTNSWRFVINLF